MKKLIVLTQTCIALSGALASSLPALAAIKFIEPISATPFPVCSTLYAWEAKTSECLTPENAMQNVFEMASVISSCASPQEFNPISHTCEKPLQNQPVICRAGQFLNASQTACMTPQALPARNAKNACAAGKILNASTSLCVDPSLPYTFLPQG